MTGMYQTTIGAHNHRSHRDDGYQLPGGVRVLTDWLRDAGYFTANVRELPAELGFRGSGKTDWNFTYEGKPFDSDQWSDLKAHQPFFAQVNFQETHRTFHAPKHADPAKVEIPPYYPDHPVTREDWAKYLDARPSSIARSAWSSSNSKPTAWPTTRSSSSSATTARHTSAASSSATTVACTCR